MKTRIWKLTALVLALLLALTGCSLIEIDAEKDNAEVVAIVGGEKITKGDVMNTYQYYLAYYSYMNSLYTGSSDISGMVENIKDEVLEAFIENKLLLQKAAELGLDQLSDEAKAEIEAQAASELDEAIEENAENVNTEGKTEEEARQAVIDYLAAQGMTLEALIDRDTESYICNLVQDSVVADVVVEDSELEAEYANKVAADEANFASSSYLYEYYRTNGTTVYWNPEGYRTVKHILLKMSDEDKAAYDALLGEIKGVNDSIAALEAAAETETTEETETAEPAEGEEAAEAPLTLEELQAKKAELETDLDEKMAKMRTAFDTKIEEINAALAAGKTFDEVMAEFGEDPGMQREPGMTEGYYVCADSTYFEPAFVEGAMALANIGDISEPVWGSNGLHIICYVSDVTAGEVGLDAVRDTLSASVLESKRQAAYAAEYQAWHDAAGVKKYPGKLN